MTSFIARLEARAKQKNTLLCIGLDPHPSDLPKASAEATKDFCLQLIEATAEYAAAFKPNSAFFEAFGWQGYRALEEVIAAIPEGPLVILDAKRGDIASTAEAYARAAFQVLGADAITLNPYLGYDALKPLLQDPQKGAFLLCKTSNPGAKDLQDLTVKTGLAQLGLPDETPLYEAVAHLAKTWQHSHNLGLVVGATHPEALCRIRLAAPDLWLLVPGVGTQGGELRQALQAGLRPDGLGMLIAVSRSISRAESPARAAAELCQAINAERDAFLQRKGPTSPSDFSSPPISSVEASADPRRTLALHLLEAGCVQFGRFTLKSGLQSPIYIDLRKLVSHPSLLTQVAEAYLPILRGLSFDRLAAIPYAALPIAVTIGLRSGWPLLYPRKEIKTYGTQAEIEGDYARGEVVVVIDDLATTAGSKFETIARLSAAGLQVKDIVVLIDRQSGAKEALDQAGYRLHAVFSLNDLLDIWEADSRVSSEKIKAVRIWLKGAANP